METLRSSSSLSALKLFSGKYYGNRDTGFFSLRDSALAMPAAEINFFRPHTHALKHIINLSFSLPKSFHQKKLIVPISSLPSSDAQTQVQHEEIDTNDIANHSKSVHVKFQLQRECSFGQQFYIVGDDPMLGLWDPSDAVPFSWSDGHIWTAELDIPIGKCFKFKIILKESPETIVWQPGPDRILQTWETENTIIVCEDWNSAELQKILEEETTTCRDNEHAINAENLTGSDEKLLIDTSDKLSAAISDKNMDILMLGNNGSTMNVLVPESTTDEGNMLSMNDLPLLVPGLSPLPTAQTEETPLKETNAFSDASIEVEKITSLCGTHTKEAPLKEVETNIYSDASIEADKSKELNMPELNLKEEVDNKKQELHQHKQVRTDGLDNEKQEQYQHEQSETPQSAEAKVQQIPKPVDLVMENDIQWGRRTLQRLLDNFGFR